MGVLHMLWWLWLLTLLPASAFGDVAASVLMHRWRHRPWAPQFGWVLAILLATASYAWMLWLIFRGSIWYTDTALEHACVASWHVGGRSSSAVADCGQRPTISEIIIMDVGDSLLQALLVWARVWWLACRATILVMTMTMMRVVHHTWIAVCCLTIIGLALHKAFAAVSAQNQKTA